MPAVRLAGGILRQGLLVAAAASALAAAPAHAADRAIARTPLTFVSPVEAYGGNVVWGQVATGRSGFLYFLRDGTGTRQLPLEDRVRGVDLGARRGGGTRAVYLRCPPRAACVLRSFDFRTGARRTLSSLVRLPGTEGSPAVWNGRIVFTRSRRGLFATHPLRRVSPASVVSTDLRGSRVAYVTRAFSGPPDNHGARDAVTTVRVVRLRRGRRPGRSCFIARATRPSEGGGVELSDVELTPTHVLWLRRDLRRSPVPGTIRRRRLTATGCPSGPEQHAREIPRLNSFAVDRGRFFYTTNDTIWEATDPPLAFTR